MARKIAAITVSVDDSDKVFDVEYLESQPLEPQTEGQRLEPCTTDCDGSERYRVESEVLAVFGCAAPLAPVCGAPLIAPVG